MRNLIRHILKEETDSVDPKKIGILKKFIIEYFSETDWFKDVDFEIGSWNGGAIDFQIGTDILCFNDPTTRTFVAFQNGQFIDVQPQFMRKYKAGRGFIAYEDLNGNLWMYKNGQTEQLSNFSPSLWDVKDDLVMWSENSYLFA